MKNAQEVAIDCVTEFIRTRNRTYADSMGGCVIATCLPALLPAAAQFSNMIATNIACWAKLAHDNNIKSDE